MSAVLLVGGTSETEAIAQALAGEGHSVLVCTATDLPLRTGAHPAIRRRCGRLTADEFEALMREEKIGLVVNAAHPYAAAVREATRKAAGRIPVPHVEFMRPGSAAAEEGVRMAVAADHREAARLAVEAGRKILLTVGVTPLAVYAEAARARGCELWARVLPRAESLAVCRAAGLRDEQVIASRGVPSAEENAELIRKHGIEVLVTKDSGEAGGLAQKCEAARRTGCAVVLVCRPASAAGGAGTVDELMEKVRRMEGRKG